MNIDCSQHYQLLSDSFSVQFNNEEFADCILIAEGKSVKVHKAILCSNSSFLQKIVADHKDLDLTFIIDGIRFDDLYLVTQFLYRGDVAIRSEQVRSVLLVAELLGMSWVRDVSLQSNHNVVESNLMTVCKSAIPAMSSKLLLPLRNITNTLSTKKRKRRKYERKKKSPQKMKIRRKYGDKSNSCQPVGCNLSPSADKNRMETDLAQMDKSTFCTALGLKKNVEVRELMKIDNLSSFQRAVPPLMKVLSNVKSKFSEVEKESESLSSFRESSPVYIEAKNLSFLDIDANELYIRENNIEIECDVLDVTSHDLLFDRGNGAAANILQLGEGNAARVIDNPEEPRKPSGKKFDRTISVQAIHKCASRAGSNLSTLATKVARGETKDSVDVMHASAGSESTIFWCDVCQRTYHTKTGLNQHKRYECCKDPAFACPRCDKRFKRKSSLVRHAITLHNEAVYPTRTKLLSKLTSPRTIAGKR